MALQPSLRVAAALSALLFLASPAGAETRYVSDVLYVGVREAPSDPARVLRTLRSGTAVEVLERQGAFARIRTEDGLEGWVKAKFLVPEPIARDRLKAAEARIAALEEENQRLEAQVQRLQGRLEETERDRKRLAEARDRLQAEVEKLRELAASPAALAEENAQLKRHTVQLEAELGQLRGEVTTLRDQTRRDWFLAGAGVLALGLLIGLVVPRIRWRRRNEWL